MGYVGYGKLRKDERSAGERGDQTAQRGFDGTRCGSEVVRGIPTLLLGYVIVTVFGIWYVYVVGTAGT